MSETSSDASGLAEETWEDWNEEETHGVQSLFCSQTFPDLEASLAFDAAEFKFDLRQYRAQASSELHPARHPAPHKDITYMHANV